MSKTALKLAQQRICVEKVKESDLKEYYGMQNASSSQQFQKLKAAFLTKKLWPKGKTIKIFFMGSGVNVPRTPLIQIEGSRDGEGNILKMDPLQTSLTPSKGTPLATINAVKKIVTERIQPIVGLKLEFTNNIDESTIRISFDPKGGAWSLLGTDCEDPQFKKKPTMNLGWLDAATTIHEFCHALGMVHEHQNPKGNQIQWNIPKVLEWARLTQGWDEQTIRHNIIDRYKVNEINGSQFDPNSIMLYFFPGSLTTDNKGTHQNLKFSGYDVKYLNKIYPNSPENPSIFFKNIYGESLNVNDNNFTFVYVVIAIVICLLLYFGYPKFKEWRDNRLVLQTFKIAQQFGIN